MSIKRSGDNRIDALLLKEYWNEADKPVTLTYSIDTSGSNGLSSKKKDNEVS